MTQKQEAYPPFGATSARLEQGYQDLNRAGISIHEELL